MDGHDNNSGRKTGRRSYTFPSKGSRSNVSPRDKLIKKKKKIIEARSLYQKNKSGWSQRKPGPQLSTRQRLETKRKTKVKVDSEKEKSDLS